MKPDSAREELCDLLQKVSTPLGNLTPAQGLRLMLDFYRDIRAEGCELDEDGDMLLFQWGTYDFGEGQSFRFDITRQFIEGKSDDDDTMSQLSLTFHFKPSPRLAELDEGSEWCAMPDGLEEFESLITSTSAYRELATAKPEKITLEHQLV